MGTIEHWDWPDRPQIQTSTFIRAAHDSVASQHIQRCCALVFLLDTTPYRLVPASRYKYPLAYIEQHLEKS